MAFWVVAGIIGVLCAGILAVAVLRPRQTIADAAEADMGIYRQQLDEVERDIARGVLSEEEGSRVRTEVARRLLDADKRRATGSGGSGGAGLPWAFGISALVIGGAVFTYTQLGSPKLPDLPIAERIAEADRFRMERASQAEVEARITVPPAPALDQDPAYLDLVQKLREAVSTRPGDLQGHMLLAQHEARLGNYGASHQALAQILDIKGEDATATDWVNYADMLVIAANGYVSPEAEQALSRALQIDPQNGTARYYVGRMFAQTGRPDRAFEFWRALLESSGASDPWVAPIRDQIEAVAMDAGVNYQLPEDTGLRGPTADDIAAAQEMSEEDRMAMIEGMVAGLSDRLATEGGTAEEWARLIRSLSMLGRDDDARAIAEEARQVFATDAASLALIEEAAR